MDTEIPKNRQNSRPLAGRPKRFRATNLAALPVGTYTDPASVGLQLRVSARSKGTETRSWLLRFKFKGTESRLLLGHFPALSLADARRAAQHLRERAAQGIDPRRATARRNPIREPLGERSDPFTVRALAADFMDRHVRPQRKRPEYAENILKRDVLPAWGDRDARTIEPREVIALLDGIVARGSPVQANRVYGIVSQLFRYGIHRQIVTDTPVKLLYRPGGKEKPKTRALSDEELRVIVQDPQQAFRLHRTGLIVMALLLTGQRRGDLAQAEWKNVNFETRLWRIPSEDAKNGREHLVPLSDLALEQFQGLKQIAGRSRYVVPSAEGNAPIDPKLITRSVARCLTRLKRLGVERFSLHDLRRTCRTGLARLGVRPDIAERVLNHSPGRLIQSMTCTRMYRNAEKRLRNGRHTLGHSNQREATMTKNVMWISVDAPKRLESSVDSLKLCLGKEADVATFIAQGNEALHFYETVRKVKRISEPAAAYNAQLARVARCAQALASALDGLAPDPASVLGAQRSRRPYRELMTESQAFRDLADDASACLMLIRRGVPKNSATVDAHLTALVSESRI